MGFGPDWGKKKYQTPTQIGPRVHKGGGMPRVNIDLSGAGRAVAGGLNAVGRAARDITQARENFNKPKPKTPARKSTTRIR